MSKVHELTWADCQRLARERFPAQGKVYGVPRGGSVAAAILGRLPADRPEDAEFIVDDIIDSGRTREHYTTKFPTKPFFALVDKMSDTWASDKWIWFPWEKPVERDAEDIVVRMIEFIGEDPKREGLVNTPERVVRSWRELFCGYSLDPKEIVGAPHFKSDGYDEIILLDNIEFTSVCEHHCLPFFGRAHVAYIPNGKIVGISKLARLVDCFSRRLQIQERITRQVADTIDQVLKPRGVAVVLEARHFCMLCRGVEKQNSVMRTSAVIGLFKEDPKARSEFFSMIRHE